MPKWTEGSGSGWMNVDDKDELGFSVVWGDEGMVFGGFEGWVWVDKNGEDRFRLVGENGGRWRSTGAFGGDDECRLRSAGFFFRVLDVGE
ncbi:hypothetical protein MRB53_014007 [Persea americana]|uniref:Uncharacterized protein n=1 Tax=Persea americana TaxID=3435 RepID=A0ACC2K9R0_PERAE|nr:hypothetical protein MRB53_014007 [Persea americana]